MYDIEKEARSFTDSGYTFKDIVDAMRKAYEAGAKSRDAEVDTLSQSIAAARGALRNIFEAVADEKQTATVHNTIIDSQSIHNSTSDHMDDRYVSVPHVGMVEVKKMPKLIQIIPEPSESSTVILWGLADDSSVWSMSYDFVTMTRNWEKVSDGLPEDAVNQ